MTCDHKFIYGGVKYKVASMHLPGTSARPVYYYDWFYCERCLERKYKKLVIEATSYDDLKFNATPMGYEAQ